MSKQTRSAHLTWLMASIQRSIDTAKVQLDAYHSKAKDLATPPSDAQPVWFKNKTAARDEALGRLRTEVTLIHSALVVGGCSGASSLALEIKILLSNIENNLHAQERVEEALVSIMTGLLAIPKYVSMVIDGAPDTPVILAKHINEIRELRGVQLLEEESMLPPGLEFVFIDPPRKIADCSQEQRNRTFAIAPKRFTTAFSNYMANGNKAVLGEMHSVLKELQEVTYNPEVGCFWWIGECLIDSIASGAVRSAGNTLSQIRMLSVAIQKVAAGGEEAAVDTLGAARFRSLLGVVAMSSRLSPEVERALAAFNVRAATDHSRIESLQARLDEAPTDSLKEVVAELGPLLETSMVSLARAVGSKNQLKFDTQIEGFRASLRQIASVFYMINEDSLAAVASQILKRVEHISGASSLASPELIDELKNDFVFLDQRVRTLNANEAVRSLALPGIGPDVVEAVVTQAVRELAITRRLITQHMDSGTGSEDLKDGLEKLLGTANALSFTGLSRAGRVLNGSCQGFMTLLKHGAIEASIGADLAARALVAVETYLSSVAANLTPSPLLLQRAEEGLAEMGLQIEHSDTVSQTALIKMFDQVAQAGHAEEEDHLLSEMIDLRSSLDRAAQSPDVRDRASMVNLYRTADRLSIAGNLYEHDQFARLARALASAANALQERTPRSDLAVQSATALIKSGVETTLRCMDEYAARGTFSLYTREIETALLGIAEPDTSAAATKPSITVGDAPDTQEQSTPQAVCAHDAVTEVAGAPRAYPDGVDGVLMELFREEFFISHKVLRDFCEAADGTITNDVRRAAHSIYGNSANAGCEPLRRVYGNLEAQLDRFATDGVLLSNVDLAQLATVIDETADYLKDFPWKTESPLQDVWLDTIQELGSDQTYVVFEEVISAETLPEQNQNQAAPYAAPVPCDATPAVQADAALVSEANPVREYNDDYGFYLEEADEVLPDLQANVSSWLGDMSNRELITTIKRQMHTLKGAALMAEAASIGAISHSMESLFESLAIKLIEPDDDCAQLVSCALDVVANLTALMRQELPYAPPETLIRCLEDAVDSNQIDLSILTEQPRQAITEPCVPQDLAGSSTTTETKPELEPATTAPLAGESSSDPAQNDADAEQNAGSAPKRTRRRRGKGGAKRHAAMRSAQGEEAGESPILPEVAVAGGDASLGTPPASAPLADEASLNLMHTLKHEPTTESSETESNRDVALVEIPHAESFDDAALRQRNYTQEAAAEFDRMYAIDAVGAEVEQKPIASATLARLLARDEVASTTVKKGAMVATEKIKVDLRLLESAAEQSSELTANRHRLAGLTEDLLLRLSTLRGRFDTSSLLHGQFTTALRGFLNTQPASRGQADEGLERFNELSAMFVALVAQFEDMREEFGDTLVIGRQMRSAIQDQALVTASLQRDLLDSRLVPFTIVRPKLLAAVKQANASTRKSVELTLIGDEVIMDRMILDSVAEPLTHVLRNAVDHGIESEQERVAAGKPAHGSIEVTVYRRAKNVVIAISDDGRGISPSALRHKAVEKGLISETDILTDKELLRLITASGFSTAAKTTNLSGRGVGMDIVATSVDNLGGQLLIDSTEGKGTTFTIELPFTIGANKAMMVSSGTQWFAIQSYSITQVFLTSYAAIDIHRQNNGYAVVEHDGHEYEVVHLADLIAMPDSRGTVARGQEATLILCEHGDTRIAVEVAQVDSMPEIHIRKLEGVLSQVRGIVGETEMQDGTVVFVLDVIELARLNLKRGMNGYQVKQNRIRSMKRTQKPVVMVIDDSRPYRSLLDRIFTGLGYIVVLAVNGQDALDKLPLDRGPDLFVVDIEMPRKSGFEFTAEVRKNPAFSAIPIIMISTKHEMEQKAKEAGVNEFLRKPFDQPTLEQSLANVTALMPCEPTV